MRLIKYNFLIFPIFIANIIFAQSNWELRNNGINQSVAMIGESIDAIDNNFVVVSYGTSLYKTNNAGINWANITPPGNNVKDICAVDSLRIFVATAEGRILGTFNGGLKWDTLFYDHSRTPFINYIKMFNPDSGIAMGDAGDSTNPVCFLQTTNGGRTWTQINTNLFGSYSNNTWRVIDFPDFNNGYFCLIPYVAGSGGIYKTIDGGKTWQNTYKIIDENYNTIKFYNQNIGVIASRAISLPMIMRTTDGLADIDTVKDSKLELAQHSDIEFVPNDSSRILYVTPSKLLYSNDIGKTWTTVLKSNPNDTSKPLLGEDIVFADNKHCWLLCDNGNVYYNSQIDNITTLREPMNSLPEGFILEQNYPNPFNPSTIIKYKLSGPGFVTMKIYDLLGREVKILLNGFKDKGSYSVIFNAEGLSSGVYLYELKAGEFVSVKKMILLR